MRVFVTGASGFIGTPVVKDLIAAGHQVLGLARSDEGAKALLAAGAEPHRGSLEDVASLRAGAEKADGVIHLAFDHDMANFVANCEKEKHAVAALGSVLVGSDRPLVITSGTGLGNAVPGQPASEDFFDAHHRNPRIVSELAGQALLDQGVNVSVVRLPQVHNTLKAGLITYLVAIAREKGSSAYVGYGTNRYPAAHISDVAPLYRLVLEKAKAGSRYNAVAEEGIAVRKIAEVLGKGLNLPVVSLSPEEAPAHFGWMAMFAGLDLPALSALTRERLGWNPTGPDLITDLEAMDYGMSG